MPREWIVENLSSTPQNLIIGAGERALTASIEILTFPGGNFRKAGGSATPIWINPIIVANPTIYTVEPALPAYGPLSFMQLPSCHGIRVSAKYDSLKVKLGLLANSIELAADQRAIKIFVPGDEVESQGIEHVLVTGALYWQSTVNTGQTSHVYLKTSPDFIAGRYAVYVNGIDWNGGDATLSLLLNGEVVYSRVTDSPFRTQYEAKVLDDVIILPGADITLRILTDGYDKGKVSSIRLVPI